MSGRLLRRLNIACGIAHKPKLLIMDEPTVAVDPQSRNKILEGIEELNRQGTTVIYTSHYMEEVEQICQGAEPEEGIAFLMGMVVKNSNMLTGAVNTIPLGMCFLCGVFVPMELIGDNVKKVARFLPAYWYEVINNLLSTHAHLTKAMHTTLLEGYAIQLVFAAACISIALVMVKKRFGVRSRKQETNYQPSFLREVYLFTFKKENITSTEKIKHLRYS